MRRKAVLLGASALIALTCVLLASAQVGEDAGCWVARETIYIHGNAGLCFEKGVTSGCGDANSPYIIECARIVAMGVDYGINIENTSKHILIRNCIIEGAGVAGIRLGNASNVVIQGCQLRGNEIGVLLESADDNAIVGNLIGENCVGVALVRGSRDNALTKNSFVGNESGAHDPGGRNVWTCGLIGNYWDDYCGVDADCNGIGDTAYDAPVVDRYPLIASPWGCSLPCTCGCGRADCDACNDFLKAIGCGQPSPCVESSPCDNPCQPEVCEPVCGQPCPVPCAPTCPVACAPSVNVCESKILTCLEPQVTLTAEFCPSKPSCEPCKIEWTRAGYGIVGTVSAITVNEPGTYTVTIVGADGCSVSDVVVVGADFDAPIVRASADRQLSCGVTEVTLTATLSGGRQPCALQWTAPGGGVLGCDPSITVSRPGTYTVTATGANGCSSSARVDVTQDIVAASVSAAASGSLSCDITEVTLSASISGGRQPYSIAWSKPGVDLVGSGPSIVVSEGGLYTVTVTGGNGCSASACVNVAEDAAVPMISASVDRMITCNAPEAHLTANVSGGRAPYAIEWMLAGRGFVGTGTSLTVVESGTYVVTATGANGCWASTEVVVQRDTDPPVVEAGPDLEITDAIPSVTLSATIEGCDGPCAITWTDMFGDVVGNSAQIVVDRPGLYTVTVVRTATGCAASDDVSVNSEIVNEVMLDSGILGLAVFGQLTLDGVPIPDSIFYFYVDSIDDADGSQVSFVSVRDDQGRGFKANGAEVYYIIPGNATVAFSIHKEQFISGKKYQLLHLPTDPPGQAAVAFF